MELIEGIEPRRSFRAFKPTPIPEATISAILKTATCSPSYTNSQPWEVAVVTGQSRDELARILYALAEADTPPKPDLPLPTSWPGEMTNRSREHGARRFEIMGIDRDDKQARKQFGLGNYKFYDAPCAFFLFMDSSLTQWSIFDVGMFAENLMLAGHNFGLGSCLQASLAHYPEAIRQFLKIPDSKKLIIGISVGYPDDDAKINTYYAQKAKPDDFTRWYR